MRRLTCHFALLIVWSACPAEPPPPVEPVPLSDGSPCGDACARMADCETSGDPGPMYEQCMSQCTASVPAEQLTCLKERTCDQMGSCFRQNQADRCHALSNRRDNCGDESVFGANFHCDALSENALDCLEAASCEDAAACLEAEQTTCVSYCDKLVSCLGDAVTRETCILDCADQGDSDLRTCVEAASCDALEPCFDPVDLCEQSCGIMNACAVIDGADIGDCLEQCRGQWTPEVVACVRGSSCVDLGDCGALP
ncbi:MAG: hypothetical protein CMH55_05190 [Myxococcales bacterium]|nr:hypothetical protein [Myxococcales bacterium]